MLEKKSHINIIVKGDNVDQIDWYKIIREIEGVCLSSMNVNTYFTREDKSENLDKKK